MPFIDTSRLDVIERLPGWHGRYFHSPNMTFAHYDFVRGASIHEHFHPQEEVYEVTEGELEVTIDAFPRSPGRAWSRSCLAMSPIRSRRSPTAAPLSLIIRQGENSSSC